MDQGDAGQHPQESRWGSFWMRNGVLVIMLFVAGVGLYQLRDYWYPIYQYRLGTSTTAIINYCDQSSTPRHIVVCTGTWTLNGESQSGIIDGADRMLAAGSSLAVHVKDGNAYTARSEHMSIFYLAFFSLLLIALCALMIRGWRRMRTRR